MFLAYPEMKGKVRYSIPCLVTQSRACRPPIYSRVRGICSHPVPAPVRLICAEVEFPSAQGSVSG